MWHFFALLTGWGEVLQRARTRRATQKNNWTCWPTYLLFVYFLLKNFQGNKMFLISHIHFGMNIDLYVHSHGTIYNFLVGITLEHLTDQCVPFFKVISWQHSEGDASRIWIISSFLNKAIKCLGEKNSIFLSYK